MPDPTEGSLVPRQIISSRTLDKVQLRGLLWDKAQPVAAAWSRSKAALLRVVLRTGSTRPLQVHSGSWPSTQKFTKRVFVYKVRSCLGEGDGRPSPT